MNLSPDYLVSLYKVRKLYDDYDSESTMPETEYIGLVDDLISYDLQLKMRREAETNLDTLTNIVNKGMFNSKKDRQRVDTIRNGIAERIKEIDSEAYLENMINSILVRLAPHRKSKSTTMLSKFDEAFIEIFYEFSNLEKCQQAAFGVLGGG